MRTGGTASWCGAQCVRSESSPSTTRRRWSSSSRDGSGALSVIFLGRRQIAGIGVGTEIEATAVIGVHQNRLAMLNPTYEIRAR